VVRVMQADQKILMDDYMKREGIREFLKSTHK